MIWIALLLPLLIMDIMYTKQYGQQSQENNRARLTEQKQLLHHHVIKQLAITHQWRQGCLYVLSMHGD